MENVLMIGAHADDIEFGCGGTAYKHFVNGDTVHYLCLTGGVSKDGVSGKILRERDTAEKEIRAACRILEIPDECIHLLGYPDLHLDFNFETVSEVEKIIRDNDISTIYTHWAGDSNQDHQAAFKITMAAARYVSNVYCYEQIPIMRLTENPMDINLYVDITQWINHKMLASTAHASQTLKYQLAGVNVTDNLTTMAKYRGIQAGVAYAEGFQIIKEVR